MEGGGEVARAHRGRARPMIWRFLSSLQRCNTGRSSLPTWPPSRNRTRPRSEFQVKRRIQRSFELPESVGKIILEGNIGQCELDQLGVSRYAGQLFGALDKRRADSTRNASALFAEEAGLPGGINDGVNTFPARAVSAHDITGPSRRCRMAFRNGTPGLSRCRDSLLCHHLGQFRRTNSALSDIGRTTCFLKTGCSTGHCLRSAR